ncbi:hypothetical protein [Xanthobacter autotrophicus]|uniref:hypothetical protein n=1 Tax=Xanthobacter autotrophicus TaxID=280 RepID=UPI00372A2FF7
MTDHNDKPTTPAPALAPEAAARIVALVQGGDAPAAAALPHVEAPPLAPDAPPADERTPADAEPPEPRRRRGRPRKRRTEDGGGENGDVEERAPRRRATAGDTIGEVTAGGEFWHAPDRTGYATVDVDGHREHWAVESKGFERWLADRTFLITGAAPTSQALRDVVRLCDVLAQRGAEHPVFRRVARMEGRIFIDLCDDSWRAVEVDRHGWSVAAAPAVKFLRSPGMLALPEPEASDTGLGELRGLVNADSDEDYVLTVAWLVGALGGVSAFPVAVLNGEAGSGKSRLATRLRALVDPHVAPMRSPPKDLRDLFAGASNEFVIVLDNISSMTHELSDELCRIASGSASSARALHTNTEQIFLTGARPIILNGIGGHFGAQADLMSRALSIRLAAIPETGRRTDAAMDLEFAAVRPRILGALLDAVSAGLRNLETVALERLPRMADFALWMSAAEPGLGWEPGTFVAAMEAGREEATQAAFDADEVAKAIVDFITDEHSVAGWEGTPSALLEALNRRVTEDVRRFRSWPTTATGMGTRIDRVAGLLRHKGLSITRRRGAQRTVFIKPFSKR